MDLVDIDQVLDNLELREQAEELHKASLLQTSTVSNNGVKVPTISGASSLAASSSTAKSFVGVSQVFNSLDDYRKNVELLHSTATQKYDEECWAVNSSNSETNDENQKILTTIRDDKSAEHYVGNENEDADEEDDDDDEACGDIHKYKDNIRKRLDIKEDYVNNEDFSEQSLSDSLTTSSSSTFSSGPSLGGIGSMVEEHSLPLSAVDDGEEETASYGENHENQPHPCAIESQYDSVDNVENREALEDIAQGLSSISITTINSPSMLRCVTTVSSELCNVIQDLETETTSTSLLSQVADKLKENPKVENITNGPSLEPNSEEMKKEKQNTEKNELNEASNQLLQAANEIMAFTKQPLEQQQPITFCSTMDDISDGELDSMLQEMDIDDEQPKISQVTETMQIKACKIDDAPEAYTSQVADCTNADSFSQASTVEFSEVKAQAVSVLGVDNAVRLSNLIATSYSSNESSLEEPVNASASDIIVDDENLRPQRPTSLDLPSVNAGIYTNAGQTPPGLGQTLENENIDDVATTGDQSAVAGEISEASGFSDPYAHLGKMPPIWVPDNMASGCMQCAVKFTVLKRRHHCRACGKVLCSACCSQKFKLEFLQEQESRVCVQCFIIFMQRQHTVTSNNHEQIDCDVSDENLIPSTQPIRSPNPNNPMEYCSTIPPHRQVSAIATPPPSVIVPVGVLKKDGSYSSNSSNSSSKQRRKRKSVMFSDGIAPGSELASSLEQQWGEAKQARRGQQQNDKQQHLNAMNKPPTPVTNESTRDITTMGLVAQLFRGSIPPTAAAAAITTAQQSSNIKSNISAATTGLKPNKQDVNNLRSKRIPPGGCDENGCFIPQADNILPPLYISKSESISDYDYKEVMNNFELVERLQRETLKFAIKTNFLVHVKICNLKCCMNRTVINFTTSGMHHVGNDEIVILLEYEPPKSKETMLEPPLPKDIFLHLYEIYREAELGRPIAELSYTCPRQSNFLGSREYGGFMFIRITFQCLQDIIVPENPFLVGILIHRHEMPWAKVFPLRLMLRLGAQYRYYPCPHISIRNRESVYAEIAQTIINFLADFRHYSYTLPTIRGMFIHMEDRQTTVMIPRNRLEDVIKAINNASDHILALGGNFSKTADGHLVCMQNTNDDKTEMYAYSTQAINIQGQPRKVTGASFIVLNEALKSTSGLSGKCSIVEDGLMVQVLPAKMEEIRNALRNQDNINIVCGPIDADELQTEIVSIKWVENDHDFNLGVKSPIDEKSMEGISSMRVHASFNYSNTNFAIRLTDIFILKFDDWYGSAQESLNAASLDITRIAEQIARSASMALVPFLDLLAASGSIKIGLRATLHQENVCYEAGARGAKLPPLYMNALDNHLIPTLHNESTGIEEAIVLELIFYILNV